MIQSKTNSLYIVHCIEAPGRVQETPWTQGIITESVTEDKMWLFNSTKLIRLKRNKAEE